MASPASQLPTLGDSTGSYNGQEEFRLGRAWLREFRAHVGQWRDPITQDYLESLVARLLPNSQLGDVTPIVTLVSSRTLNAFAVPGGVIGINTGLFAYAPDQDAFASVLAHEMGHLSQHHFAREMARSERAQLPTMAAMLAGLVVAASGGGNLGVATMAGTQAAAMQSQLSYSRRYEQEADRVGLQAMARSNMDPMAMPRMFATMQRLSSMQGNTPPEFLLTHPMTDSRLSNTTSLAQQYQTGNISDPGPEYDLIRARAMLAMNMSDPTSVRTRLEQDKAHPIALRYLDALNDSINQRTDQALAAFDQLAREAPDILMLSASAADAALDAGRREEAIRRCERILRLTPDYYPAQIIQSEAQLGINPTTAFRSLRVLADTHAEDPDLWNLLSEAAGRSGREDWGHLALAEQLQLKGDIEGGLEQLRLAEKASQQSGDYALTSRIRERRRDFGQYQQTLEKFR
ncbi:putative beta-barrel assembly-enhancing protease [Kushneria pakistanensis]|uniref:Beta-barrel assembly-enhancing protease n=2 Tax=Kushneria pakistanensis TaxID=1508770 RepID=A0ABQ3FAE2_9GAMM|nr:putative beta-barrel assembly-enhancing protease [Kushneria pakistanensis]